MELQQVLEAVEALSLDERQEVRARLDRLDSEAAARRPLRYADSATVRRTASELMQRYPESLRQLVD